MTHVGDCLEVMRGMAADSVDAIVTDPPYGLSFMGKRWDYDVPSIEVWAECLRVLKPGGHLLAFAGTRTQHRMAVRIEDAGFEIRDMIAWVYGSGFPKSLDVSKAIDNAEDYKLQAAHRRAWVESVQEAGLQIPGNSRHDWTLGEHAPGDKWWAEFQAWLPGLADEQRARIERIVIGKGFKPRPTLHTGQIGGTAQANEYSLTASATDAARQWQGWGTALKPALEPITVARKPLVGTVAANVLTHGTGALNIDGCRVETFEDLGGGAYAVNGSRAVSQSLSPTGMNRPGATAGEFVQPAGRWPANLIHDGSDEVLAMFPDSNGSGAARTLKRGARDGEGWGMADEPGELRDAGTGSAARFFYCAKATRADRNDGLASGPVPAVGAGATMRDRETADWAARNGNHHPTVKPTDLMRYLCRLVTPAGGLVLDPFAGSGSTGKAAALEGFQFIGIELEPAYAAIAEARIAAALATKAAADAAPQQHGLQFGDAA
ncbi:DNA methyltransferase [Xanthomonas translucens]|uniref:DNA methyltransferase n=1 Tax=Xanthomonas campestris pv. translucens TaxID=343 RepID=UPI000A5A00AE|nr:DNA methyltransferase [Xanthomonas translucens]UPU47807.1 site-specific DNA-methyltransferase [Xanthomonas translucens pv. undulosa]